MWLLLQSPPHLVNNDTALLQQPWERADNASQLPGASFSSDSFTQHWNHSSSTVTSLCQHSIDTYPATFCNGTHQMTLRPPPDLDPALVCDIRHCSVYDPELSAMENPEYFHANSVLFAAHQLRSQRYGRAFFENWKLFCVHLLPVILLFICLIQRFLTFLYCEPFNHISIIVWLFWTLRSERAYHSWLRCWIP